VFVEVVMANEEVCAVNLSKLSKPEQEEVRKEIKRLIRKAEQSSDISDINDAIMIALDEYEKMVAVAAKIEKRNAYLNRRAQQEMYDYISTNWSDNPTEGMMAYLVGSQRERLGARRSVAVSIEAQQNLYKNILRAKLTKAGMMPDAKSGKFDKEIYKAMDAIHRGDDLGKFSDSAVALARIYDDVNKMMRNDANKSGAVIGELDGFVVSRHHDMFKVRADRQGWVDWMINNVDWDRSFPGIDDADRLKMLEKQANEFASGEHVSVQAGDDPGKGLKGFSSIAKRMSKNRVYHFKSADAEFEYGNKFGEANLLRSIISAAEQRGRSVAMMKRLGPNAEMNMDNVITKYKENISRSGITGDAAEKMEDIGNKYEKIKENIMPVLTGRSMIPGNHLASTLESLLLTIQRTASLGGSAIMSVVGDSGVHAYNVARMNGNIAGLFEGYGEYIGGLFRNLNDPEVQDLLADLAVTNDYLIGTLPHRFGTETAAITRTQRSIQNIENQFFFWNGQYFADTRARASAAIGIATRFGRNADKSFDGLRDGFKSLLNTHMIDADDWDLMRQSLKDYQGTNVLNIEGIKNLPDDVVDKYLSAKGVKANKFNRDRELQDLIDRTRGMFQDQQGYSILAADARLRAMMFGGSKSGTPVGTVRKAFWQFKQFPAAFIQKMWGREIYSQSPMHSKVINISGIMAMSVFSGYMALTVTDLRKGRKPRVLTGDGGKDAALITESFFKGGGAGVYGDFLYSMMQDQYGNSPVSKFMGPSYADVDSMSKGISAIMNGDYEKGGDILTKVGISNIPFANIPPLKAALDYAILNQLSETLSPGMLRRSENRLRKEKGQEYFMMKPSETMLFGR